MLELVIVLSLATWRLTSLLYTEDGPKQVFRKLRSALGILHDSEGEPAGYPETFWGGLFACFWCLSVWVAGFLILPTMLIASLDIWRGFLMWLGTSAGAIIVHECTLGSLEDG